MSDTVSVPYLKLLQNIHFFRFSTLHVHQEWQQKPQSVPSSNFGAKDKPYINLNNRDTKNNNIETRDEKTNDIIFARFFGVRLRLLSFGLCAQTDTANCVY